MSSKSRAACREWTHANSAWFRQLRMPKEEADHGDAVTIIGRELPNVFVRSFWGFDPESASLIGFTRLGDRKAFLDEFQKGDLVLIYGADGGLTEEKLAQVGHATS